MGALLALLALGALVLASGKKRASPRSWSVGDAGTSAMAPRETVLMPPLAPGAPPYPMLAWVAWQVVQALRSRSSLTALQAADALGRSGPDGWPGSQYLALLGPRGVEAPGPGAQLPPVAGEPPASWEAVVRWQVAQAVRSLDPVAMHRTAGRLTNLGYPAVAAELHEAADDWEDALRSPLVPTSRVVAGMRANDARLLREWAPKVERMGYTYLGIALRDAARLITDGRMPLV